MRFGSFVAIAALISSGCLPSFEDAECYADVDCPGGLVCGGDNRCVDDRPPPRDAGASDANSVDAGPSADGGAADAGTNRDGGGGDAGFDVRATPATIDFGVRAIGCPPDTRTISLANALLTVVPIDNVLLTAGTSSEFTFTAPATPFDLTVMPRTIDVTYAATNAGIDQGGLQIVYGSERLDVNLSGEGQMNPQVMETITSTAGPIDIVFVVDSSASMNALQQRLAMRLLFMLLRLDFEGWDYRIVVTTMDITPTGPAGLFLGVPKVITRGMPNRQTLLENRVMAGQTGAEEERAFDAVRLALSPPLINGANAGFLRADAPLLIIYFSPDEEASNVTIASHVQFLVGLKSATMAPVVTNVIAAVPTFCTLKGGASGFRAQRFIDIAQQTAGTLSDICSITWDPAVTTFPPVTPPRRFTLSQPAVPPTISVRVEGVLQPSNGSVWTYEEASRTIVFEETATPALGDRVQVTYRPAC